MSTPVLTCHDVTKKFGSTMAIDGVTLAIEPGEVVGFVGPNGAGKSTTIRLIMGLAQPTSGTVSLGVNRCEIGYCPGELRLDDQLTVGHTLRTWEVLRGGVDPTWVEALTSRFGLDTKRRVRALSTGNRRKLGLVGAFMARPAFLVLDEPTNGLAPLMQEVFATTLREAVDRDATVLLSSHILAEVQHIATRVVALRGGQVVADAPLDSFTAVRTVDALVDASSSPPDFTTLEGADKVRVRGNRVTFEWTGDPDLLVDKLRKCQLTALTVGEPDLEATLRSYYRAV